mmetsp:Transcript_35173/g.100212  ORF Transcript_35173/g.100212 Transcript_35173/m.100212 type:complete len:370 (-) Transcript_35173:584-1693(-)
MVRQTRGEATYDAIPWRRNAGLPRTDPERHLRMVSGRLPAGSTLRETLEVVQVRHPRRTVRPCLVLDTLLATIDEDASLGLGQRVRYDHVPHDVLVRTPTPEAPPLAPEGLACRGSSAEVFAFRDFAAKVPVQVQLREAGDGFGNRFRQAIGRIHVDAAGHMQKTVGEREAAVYAVSPASLDTNPSERKAPRHVLLVPRAQALHVGEAARAHCSRLRQQPHGLRDAPRLEGYPGRVVGPSGRRALVEVVAAGGAEHRAAVAPAATPAVPPRGPLAGGVAIEAVTGQAARMRRQREHLLDLLPARDDQPEEARHPPAAGLAEADGGAQAAELPVALGEHLLVHEHGAGADVTHQDDVRVLRPNEDFHVRP